MATFGIDVHARHPNLHQGYATRPDRAYKAEVGGSSPSSPTLLGEPRQSEFGLEGLPAWKTGSQRPRIPSVGDREKHVKSVLAQLRQFPVVAVLGARQVGKTTLAKQVCAQRKGPTHFFGLEDEQDRARLADPRRPASWI